MNYNIFKIKTALFVTGLILSLNTLATNKLEDLKPLSESSYISLLTCDPGPELYATFGHSAIGVVDPQQSIMMVFNYGTFSFNVPFFYAKFASGKLLYQLSTSSYTRFLREYEYRQRRVVEEKLNLNQAQRQRLFNALKENYKPENRKYQYDFFFDNCATRIIDIFYDALGDSLVYVPPINAQPKSFRYLIDEYLGNNYWSDFGIDLALGSVIDKNATAIQQTFLPDYLSAYINHCEINGQAFVMGKRALVKETANFPPTPWYLRPALMNWFLFVLVAFLTIFLRSKSWVIGDRILFGAFGLVGLVVLLLWVATDHDATAGNLNVLWANPLYMIVAWLIGSKHHVALKWASTVILALNLGVLLGWNTLPQQFHLAFIPLIGLLILRSGLIALRSWRMH